MINKVTNCRLEIRNFSSRVQLDRSRVSAIFKSEIMCFGKWLTRFFYAVLFQETRNEIAPPHDICLALLIAQAMCGKAFTGINFLDGPFSS